MFLQKTHRQGDGFKLQNMVADAKKMLPLMKNCVINTILPICSNIVVCRHIMQFGYK